MHNDTNLQDGFIHCRDCDSYEKDINTLKNLLAEKHDEADFLRARVKDAERTALQLGAASVELKRAQGALADAGNMVIDNVEQGIRDLTKERDNLRVSLSDMLDLKNERIAALVDLLRSVEWKAMGPE